MAVIKRSNGKWYPRVEQQEPCRRCADCNRPHWVLDGRVDRCRCGGDLRDPNDERRMRFGGRGYRTKRDAQDAELTMKGAVRDGTYTPPTNITLRELGDRFLAARSTRVRPSVRDSYAMVLTTRVYPVLGSVRVKDLTPDRLTAFYGTMTGRGGRALSARTRRYTAMVVGSMLRDAVRWGLVARNVADAADPPKVTLTRTMTTWTPDEVVAFERATADDRLHAAWTVLLHTGCRRGEALALRWEDIDLDAGRASIVRNLVLTADGPTFGEPKTKRSRRSIDLDGDTIAALRSWRARQAAERLAAGSAWTDTGLVFTTALGLHLNPGTFSWNFEQAVRRAGVPAIRLHDTRHTHATLLLAAGVHPKVVSERLGHASISITLDTYSHVLPTMQRDAADRFGALLRGVSAAVR